MARLQRIAPKDIPIHIHIIQRGNNRQVCFGSDAKHAAFAEWLKEYSQKYREEIEALTGRRVKEKKIGRPVGWRKAKA